MFIRETQYFILAGLKPPNQLSLSNKSHDSPAQKECIL